MSLPDLDNDPFCPGCGDQVPDGELVSLTGHPDLCSNCADEALKREPVMRLWDVYGNPRLPHVPCPKCGETDRVASRFDTAMCFRRGCGWNGSLTAMRSARAQLESFPTLHVEPITDWNQTSTPFEDLTAAVGRAQAETLLARAPGTVTDRQVEQLEAWRLRRQDTARLVEPSPIADQLAIVTVFLLCASAIVGVLACWWVSG